ncbi:hypothetical protein SGCOL_003063 [Colletotrichum sp. CLE4]
MIVRSIVSRHGSRALLAPALARSCHRAGITTDALVGAMTPETFADLTTSAALGQIPGRTAAPSLQHDPDAVAARTEAIEARSKTVPNAYNRFRRQQNLHARVGASVGRPYVPSALIENPPSPKDISLELLMASQTHMGHHTSRWNPANARYIYGVRQGIHIISLETTAAYLRRAARVVEEVAYRGGLILFAGTRKGQMDIVTSAAKLAGGCHLFTKWTPGNITNRDVINQGKEVRIVDEKDLTLQGFERLQRTGRPLVPDLIVCLNPRENYTMLYECGLANVPTIGIIDTDANPDWVTYAVPANDDSYRSVAVIAGVLGRAGEAGQKRRLAAAENGESEWTTPLETQRFMKAQEKAWKTELKKWEMTSTFSAHNKGESEEARLLEMLQVDRTKAVDGEL